MVRVVLGLPMYRSEQVIGPVLESLLAQDFDDFAVVAVDDESPDATAEIAQRYADRDARLVVERNPERVGMIANWNRALEVARERHPEFEYFAWASDNDLREPSWVSTLVRALEQDPRAALAYSRFGTFVDGDKVRESRKTWIFDSREIVDPLERLRATTRGMRAGPIMYGLHRRDTLERIAPIPSVLLSDFIFLSRLSLYGTFVQTPEVLWFRDVRRMTGAVRRKQRAALFAGRPPATTYLPAALQHFRWLVQTMVIDGDVPAGVSRARALEISCLYLANWGGRTVRRAGRMALKRRNRLRKSLAARRKRVLRSRIVRRGAHTRWGRRVARAIRQHRPADERPR